MSNYTIIREIVRTAKLPLTVQEIWVKARIKNPGIRIESVYPLLKKMRNRGMVLKENGKHLWNHKQEPNKYQAHTHYGNAKSSN